MGKLIRGLFLGALLLPLAQAQQSQVYLEECSAADRAFLENPPDKPLCVEGAEQSLYIHDGIAEWIKLQGQVEVPEPRYTVLEVVDTPPAGPAEGDQYLVLTAGAAPFDARGVYQFTAGAWALQATTTGDVVAVLTVGEGEPALRVQDANGAFIGADPEVMAAAGYLLAFSDQVLKPDRNYHAVSTRALQLPDIQETGHVVRIAVYRNGRVTVTREDGGRFVSFRVSSTSTNATTSLILPSETIARFDSANNGQWRMTLERSSITRVADATERDAFDAAIPGGMLIVDDDDGSGQQAIYQFTDWQVGFVDLSQAFADVKKVRLAALSVVDDLTTGGAGSVLSAEQGKLLKQLIDQTGERVSVADNAEMAADTASPDGTTFFVVDDGAQAPAQWGLYQRIAGVDQRVLGQDDLIEALLALTDAQATDKTDTTVGLVAGGAQLSAAIDAYLTYERVEANGQTLQPWGRYLFNASGSPVVTTAIVADGTVDGQMLWIANNAATTTANGVRVDGKFYVPAFDAVIPTSITPQDVWLPLIWNDTVQGWMYEDFARGPELWTNASSGGGLAPNSTYLAKTTNPTTAIMPEIVAWKMGMWMSPENTGAISFFLNTPAQRFVLPDGSLSDSAYIPGPDVIYVEFVADNDGVNERWVIYEQNKPFSVGEWQAGETVTTQTERIAPRVSDGELRLWRSDAARITGATFDQTEQDQWTDLGGYTSPGVRAYLVRPETNAPTGGATAWRDAGGGINAVPHVTDGDTRNGTNACRYAGASFQYCRRYVPDGGILDTVVISAQNEGRTTPIVLQVNQDGRQILRIADIVPDFADGAGYVDVSYTLPYPIVSDTEDVEILTVGASDGGASFRIAEIGYEGGIRVARPVIKKDDGSLTTDAGVPVTPAANETLALDLLSLPWPGIWEQDPSALEWRLIGVPTERPPVPTQAEIEATELLGDTQITLTGDRFRQGVEALVDAPIVRQPDTTELPYRTTNVSVDGATYVLPAAPITDRIVGLSIQAGHTVTLPAPFGAITNDSTERWYRAFAHNGAAWELYQSGSDAAANDHLFVSETAIALATAGEPTLAEVQAYATANTLSDQFIRYTASDTDTDTPTRVYHVDGSGLVTLVYQSASLVAEIASNKIGSLEWWTRQGRTDAEMVAQGCMPLTGGATYANLAAANPITAAAWPGLVSGNNFVISTSFRGVFVRNVGGNAATEASVQADATARNGLRINKSQVNWDWTAASNANVSKGANNNLVNDWQGLSSSDPETRPVNIALTACIILDSYNNAVLVDTTSATVTTDETLPAADETANSVLANSALFPLLRKIDIAGWQSISATHTASCGEKLHAFAGPVTLPDNPAAGCVVTLADPENDWSTNNVLVNVGTLPASQTISAGQGGAGVASFTLDSDSFGKEVIVQFDGATNWIVNIRAFDSPDPRPPLSVLTLSANLVVDASVAKTLRIDPGGADRTLTLSEATDVIVKVSGGQPNTVTVVGTTPVRVLAPGEVATIARDSAANVEAF